MNITNPGGPPDGLNLQTRYDFPSVSDTESGDISLSGNIACFQFDGADGSNVTCNVVLSDSAGNGPLAAGSVQVVDGATGFVQFQDFPPPPDGSSRRESCSWAVAIMNNISQGRPTISMTIFA